MELIAQSNFPISHFNREVLLYTTDSLGRKLVHQYCIYENLEGLQELIRVLGKECLEWVDRHNTNCAHFVGKFKFLYETLKGFVISTKWKC